MARVKENRIKCRISENCEKHLARTFESSKCAEINIYTQEPIGERKNDLIYFHINTLPFKAGRHGMDVFKN